jgi:phosphatidate cytidylyltransferase
MGSLLTLLAAAVLFLDPEPTYPFLLLLILVAGSAAVYELHLLLPASLRPPFWLSLSGTLALLLANWVGHLPWKLLGFTNSGQVVLGVLTAAVMAAFVVEMLLFREPGSSTPRIAIACWMILYLGFLPGFLVQLRWKPNGVAALILAIFVPKWCDIGAYATGRLFGRHPMSPVLSPSKTFEGLAGGLLIAIVAALVLNRCAGGGLSDLKAIGFGLTVGAAGVLGDLAESLIKRDCRQKDASHIVPGFGGVLDVIDSVIFAAPVAWVWLR